MTHSTEHYLFLLRNDAILIEDRTQLPPLETCRDWVSSQAPLSIQAVEHATSLCDHWGEWPSSVEAPEGYSFVGLRGFAQSAPYSIFVRAGIAYQLMNWVKNSQHCGRCGTLLHFHETERARVCKACEFILYPPLSPAIIVAVQKGNLLLLARSPHFKAGMVSVLAGFVEAGESLEDTVRREVFEEVGVRVKNIRYFGSQPWPFPHSLMLGFTAEWESGEIQVDGIEIESAGWYSVDNTPPLPSSVSIASQLIENWKKRVSRKKTHSPQKRP